MRAIPGASRELAGPTRITGSAGSGKTEQLVLLAADWLAQGGDPRRLVAVVRSREGEERLRQRIEARLSPAHPSPQVVTHEGLARLVLERMGSGPEEGEMLAPGARWLVMAEALRRTRERLPRLGRLADSPGCVDDALELVSATRRALVGPGLLAERILGQGQVSEAVAEVPVLAAAYQGLLQETRSMDTQDLHSRALELLLQERAGLRGWADLLLVDEAEDLSPAQWYLVRELGERLTPPRRLVLAGDWSESTPGFRGASSETSSRPLVEYFPSQLAPAEWPLGDALPAWARATAESLGVASEETPSLLPLPEAAFRVPAPEIAVWAAEDEGREAEAVARELRRLRLDEGLPYSQCAVLFPSGSGAPQALLAALSELAVPHRCGALQAAEAVAREVLLGWLRCLAHGDDDSLLEAALTQGPGRLEPASLRLLVRLAASSGCSLQEAFWERLEGADLAPVEDRAASASEASGSRLSGARAALAGAGVGPSATLAWLSGASLLDLVGRLERGSGLALAALRDLGLARGLAGVAAAAAQVVEAERRLGRDRLPLSEWQERLELVLRRGGGAGSAPGDGEEVEVLTTREAKGGHWQRVFLIGCNSDRLPARPDQSGLLAPEEAEELVRILPELEDVLATPERRQDAEGRLFLVALTRAGLGVTCSWALRRDGRPAERSPFLDALLRAGASERPAPRAGLVSREDLVVRLALEAGGPVLPELGPEVAQLRHQLRPWDPVQGGGVRLRQPLRLSATGLRSWLACPRQFLADRLVSYPEESPAALRGTEAHLLLERAYRERQRWAGSPERFRAFCSELIETEILPRLRAELADRIELEAAQLWLRRAVERWAALVVAPGPAQAGEPLAEEVHFELERPGWTLSGVVDAIWSQGDGSLEVVDYKSGASASDAAVRKAVFGGPEEGPSDWQLPLYLLAAREGALDERLADRMPDRIRNWYLGQEPSRRPPGRLKAAGFTVVQGDEGRPGEITTAELERISQELDRQAELIARGEFPALPRHDHYTCLARGGCVAGFWCDGQASVGRDLTLPVPRP